MFSIDITPEEERFGFRLVEAPEGRRAVARIGDLRAVKVQVESGIEYAVCDARLQPIYLAAKTLKELRDRFARGEFTG